MIGRLKPTEEERRRRNALKYKQLIWSAQSQVGGTKWTLIEICRVDDGDARLGGRIETETHGKWRNVSGFVEDLKFRPFLKPAFFTN